MKKLLLSLLLLSLACGPQNDIHKIHDSTEENAPKPKRSCGCNEWHVILYQNNEIVQEYDTAQIIYAGSDYTKIKYKGQKYQFHMEYIAEPLQ
jgi:hypothetical protein